MKIKSFITGAIGTNCYLVWDEESTEAMLIDPGAYEPGIRNNVAGAGLMLKYIVLTHGHGDHIGGVPELLVDFPEALLVAGEADLDLVGDTRLNISAVFFGRKILLEPDILLKDGDEIELGGLSFQVIGTPGHTPGGLSFYIRECDEDYAGGAFSGTVFTGDTIFRASVGRTDLPGGDFGVLAASIREKLFALPDDTLALPGHMDATTIGYEKKYNPFVR